MPSLRQASFQAIFASPLTRTLPSLSDEVLGLGLQAGGDLGEERVAGLADRGEGTAGSSTGWSSSRPRPGPAGRSSCRCSTGCRRLQAEDLGGDDRQDGPGAGADVLGGAPDLDGAVGVDRAGDLLVLRAAAAPLVQGHAEPALDRPLAVLAAGLAVLPADQLGPDLDLGLVDRRAEVVLGEVLEPDLQRVDPQLVGQVVHGRFHDGAALRDGPGPAWPGRCRR